MLAATVAERCTRTQLWTTKMFYKRRPTAPSSWQNAVSRNSCRCCFWDFERQIPVSFWSTRTETQATSGRERTIRLLPAQWRTQKIFMGGFWFRVIWWSFVFGVRCLWRHNLTSFPCFQTNVLATFLDIIMHIFLHPLLLFHVALHWT